MTLLSGIIPGWVFLVFITRFRELTLRSEMGVFLFVFGMMWCLALRMTYNDSYYSHTVVLYLVSFLVAWFTLCSCLWDVGTFLIKTWVIWRTWELCSREDIGDCRIGVWRFLLAISTILRRTCWSAIGHQMVRKWHQGVQIVWCTSGTQHQEEFCTRYSLWTFTQSVTNATCLRHCVLKPHLNVQLVQFFFM